VESRDGLHGLAVWAARGGSWFNGSCVCWRCGDQPPFVSIGKRQLSRACPKL
jgi:hypothetical protein